MASSGLLPSSPHRHLHLPFAFRSLLLFAGAVEMQQPWRPLTPQPKAIYGQDNRRDHSASAVLVGQSGVDDSALKTAGGQTVAMFKKQLLQYDGATNT